MPENFETFDFLINDDDEVMLLLYEREGEPATEPRIEIDIDNKAALLYRNTNDVLELAEIEDAVLSRLPHADKILVCELSREEDEDGDNAIRYAYEAEVDL